MSQTRRPTTGRNPFSLLISSNHSIRPLRICLLSVSSSPQSCNAATDLFAGHQFRSAIQMVCLAHVHRVRLTCVTFRDLFPL